MKKWKMILTALVLIVAAGAGTFYYFLNVKQYHTKDVKVDKIVKSNYQIKLPGHDTNQQQNSGQAGNSESKQTASGNSQTAAGNQTQTVNQTVTQNQTPSQTQNKPGSSQVIAKAGSSPKAETKLSSSDILAEYQPVFKDLENQANEKVDTLLSYALNECSNKKAQGEAISYFFFYAKYNAAGKQLEASTDASFNYIYGSLLSDLKKNGYSVSLADPIKEQYNSMKESRRTTLLKKAIAHFS